MYDLKIVYTYREDFLHDLDLLHGCWLFSNSDTLNVGEIHSLITARVTNHGNFRFFHSRS